MARELLHSVAPSVASLAEQLLSIRPREEAVTLDGIRANTPNLRALMGSYRGQVTERDIVIALRDGEALSGRLFTPAGADADTLVVYAHGGGWVYGDTEFVADVAAYMALSTQARVLSISYRLAPEHHSPAAEVDVVAQLRAIAAEPGRVAPSARRIVVVGDSAGGYLALRAMLQLSSQERRTVEGLVLIYPAVNPPNDATRPTTPDGITLTANRVEMFWNLYQPNPSARASATDAEGTRSSLASLPPTSVVTVELDPLREEGQELAAQLSEIGVLKDVVNLRGQLHGLLWMRGLTDEADQIFDVIRTHIHDQ
ncbi:alpha/beta hydrolase [Arthrobacter sulfonylureivorans]|uniref:Alpha/beta hydrolase n=1 Tax=Arthrobacter sulfonylureivorans TaxID=2486855 RepID=A0ABY3WEX6_9MICC|nr:alpha/beta hydrolase [Arthrobacter sulfonylureivorans]UNK47780.1 alpha/beta hydrolase [Arthrobacter sulfonylureivorans]